MGGKSGGYDTSGMEEATKQANELQERIYDESVARGMPYYDVGTSGLGMLADYMGLGGGSMQTESQIRNNLLPQYTQQNTVTNANAGLGSFQDFQGAMGLQNVGTDAETLRRQWANYQSNPDQYSHLNIGTPATSTTSTTDYDGLNAAIQAQIEAQGGSRPDYFGSLLQNFDADKFEQDPGYQFQQAEGQKAIERQLAAQGKTYSPEAAKALMEYNQGVAAQSYGDAYNRYNADQSNIYNRLAGIAGIGQNQTGQMAGLGQQYGTSVSNNLTNLATAQSQAAQAEAQSRGSMFGTLLGLGGSILAAPTTGGGSLAGQLFSDRRLKEAIKEVGEVNGVKTYEFSYKGDPDKRYRGVMAQDIVDTHPDAIAWENGFMKVDYSKIDGVDMEEV